MEMTIDELRTDLCKALCANIDVRERPDGRMYVSTPFRFSDGDSFSIYLERLPAGGFRISDLGGTLMHLSYEQDIDKLREGARLKVFSQILGETGLIDDEGELRLDVAANRLGDGIFQFGQALTRVHDLTMLNRVQVESTFYDDLYERLTEIVGADRVIRDYTAPGLAQSQDYPIDFAIPDLREPLLIFGVPSQSKARLATIVMQHLLRQNVAFRGMVVYADMSAIPRPDVSRLTAVANDQVPTLLESEALIRKVKAAVAAY